MEDNIKKGIEGRKNAIIGNITGSFDLQKARSGTYADNEENRRLKRVGQPYGKKGDGDKEPTKSEPSKKEESKASSKTDSFESLKKPLAKFLDGHGFTKDELSDVDYISEKIENFLEEHDGVNLSEGKVKELAEQYSKAKGGEPSNRFEKMQKFYEEHNKASERARVDYNTQTERLNEDMKKFFKERDSKSLEESRGKMSELAKNYTDTLNKLSEELRKNLEDFEKNSEKNND